MLTQINSVMRSCPSLFTRIEIASENICFPTIRGQSRRKNNNIDYAKRRNSIKNWRSTSSPIFCMSTSTIENLAKVFRVNKDALKPEETDGKPGTIVKEFCLNTSAHGLAGIARSRSICNCLFWTIPTLGFMGVMTFLIIQAVMDYLGYPTQTSVEIINTWGLPFPAVTICNRAPIRFDAILEPFLNYTNATEYSPELLGSLLSFLRASEEASNFSGEYFFSLSSMLISCTYNGIKCSPDNFTTFSVRQYGLCYTFNAKLKSASGGSVHLISDYGSTGELKMEFYVHRHQYVPFLQRGWLVSDALGLSRLLSLYLGEGDGRHAA